MNPYRPQRNYGCRIRDGFTYYDMRTIVLENEKVRVSILVDKGTEIFEFLYKPKDMDFMWLSQNGVQNPDSYLSSIANSNSAFIDNYSGGWQEVFPNGGPTSSYLGAQFGQHGEVAQMPWHYEIIKDLQERITVKFSISTKKVPFALSKTLTLVSGEATLYIDETLENLSEGSHSYMWGQHIAFGNPFLDGKCVISMPNSVQIVTEKVGKNSFGRVKRGLEYTWPMAIDANGKPVDLSLLPAKGTASDIVYLKGFDSIGWFRVENREKRLGIEVKWDANMLPNLWYWQEFGATMSYPWYGRHYNIGLEPFVGYPANGIEAAIANGSAGYIGPGMSQTFSMKVTPFES